MGNRVALVTGGTTGIGLEIARRLAAGGADVYCATNDRSTLDAAESIDPKSPGSLVPMLLDVTEPASVNSCVESIVQSAGRLDLLVNAAGVMTYGRAEDVSDEAWRRTIDVNLSGTFYVSRAAVPNMRSSGGGVIVNFSSIVALATGRSRVAYSAAKSGILGLTRAMALDHAADRIRVVAVCPGAVETEMLRQTWRTVRPDVPEDEMRRMTAEGTPLGRIGSASDIADAVEFLASERASFVTGQAFVIDGGLLAQLATPQAR
jgi:NAD(P)-dependent dehydrogenase (short-subunit alcohol dehydrogenase family)